MNGSDPVRLAELAARELRARANPDKAAPMAAYMKTEMPFYGVQKPGRREVLRALEQFRPQSLAEYRAGVLALWGRPHREEKYLAIAWARRWNDFIRLETLDLYERLIREGAWWDLVDGVAPYLVGQLLLEHRRDLTAVMKAWIHDDDLWIRRSALISQLRHKAQTDAGLLFEFCVDRASEREFFIRKAIGWALREYSKSAPERVADFLAEHREVLSPLSFREGNKVLARRASAG